MKYVPLQIVLIATFIWSLSSCIEDKDGISTPDGELTVRFTVNMPGGTRSMGDSPDREYMIETLDVLAFVENSSGDFVYTYAATNITQTPGSGTNITVTVRVREYIQRQQFMVLVNASDELAAVGPIQGKKLIDVANMIICDAGSGEWPADNNGSGDMKALPMYGKTVPHAITISTGSIGTYALIRMVSRIDVTLAAAVNNFQLVDASLFNYKKAGYVSYERSNLDDTASPYPVATTPAVPASGDHSGDPIQEPSVYFDADYANDARGEILRSIYTYESPAITTDADKLNGTALVIGGYYGGDNSKLVYYRVDIKTTDDTSGRISSGLLRNHHYKVQIQSVSDKGYSTAIEAYKGAKAIDFAVKVIPWGEEMAVPLPYAVKRPANCYLISPDDGSFNIPVFGQIDRAKADGGLSGIWADNNTKLAAEVLWSEREAVEDIVANLSIYRDPVDITKSLLTVTPGEAIGNTVVCVYNDLNENGVRDAGEDILWSWHIWSCAVSDFPKEFSGNRWMDRDLGALRQGSWEHTPNSVTEAQNSIDPVKGLYYQYGRKDPLPVSGNGRPIQSGTVVYQDITGTNTVEASVKQPAARFTSWTGNVSTWSTTKSVYDPCPDGWRVPSEVEWSTVSLWSTNSAYSWSYTTAGMIALYRNVGGRVWNTILNTTKSVLHLDASMGPRIESSDFSNYTNGGFHTVRCIRDAAAQPGGVSPTLTTDYDRGKIISADGSTYILNISSNTAWEASVRRGTDVFTSGGIVGEPLLDRNRGLNGDVPWSYIPGSGNGTLTLVTNDYTGSSYADGELEIVFRDKDTGVILNRVPIKVITGIVLRSNRLVASVDAATGTMNWAQAMGIELQYNSTKFWAPGEGTRPVDYPLGMNIISGCAGYSEPGYPAGGWRLPTMSELNEMYGKKDKIAGLNTTAGGDYWSCEEGGSGASTKNFYSNSHGSTAKTYSRRVRCVRSLNAIGR